MFVFSFETGKEQRIGYVSSGEHCWSPDGAAIFFNERGTGVRFDLATGRKTPMFGDDEFRLANCQGDVVLVRVGHGIAERRMRIDSQRELYRTTADAGTTTPVMSHDGRRVAYLTPGVGAGVPSSQAQLHVLSIGGGLVRNLVTEKAPAQLQPYWGLAWSADDRYIYFLRQANETSPYELMRAPATGGAPEGVGLSGEDICELDMAPDGKRIAFSVCVTNRPEIWELKGFLPKR
jgi:hypothetical protein